MSKFKPKINVLVSYAYASRGLMNRLYSLPREQYRLLLDCGAFTAWSLGKEVTLDSYCMFLERHADLFDYYASLDVVKQSIPTHKNYLELLRRGFNPTPVFTQGMSFSLLEEYFKLSPDEYVLLGGIAQKRAVRYLEAVMKRVNGRKVHWFGLSERNMVNKHRPYSLDVSSWKMAQLYGGYFLYIGGGRMICDKLNKFLLRYPTEQEINLIRFYGSSLDGMRHTSGVINRFSIPNLVTLRSWLTYSFEAERKLNTRIYLGVVAVDQIDNIESQRDKYVLDASGHITWEEINE